MLSEAGLHGVRTELLEDRVAYDGPEDWMAKTARLAGPVRVLFSGA